MATDLQITTFQSQRGSRTLDEDEIQYPRPEPHEIAFWISSKSHSQKTQNRIRELLVYAERNLDVLERQIWQVMRTSTQDISSLLRRREEDMIQIRVMREVTSALYKVPPEVLGRIFVHYVKGTILLPIPSDPATNVNPLKLGHVSSFWRQVFWSTPEAWKIIKIGSDGGTYTIEKLLSIRSAIEYIFSRSTATHSVIVNDHTSTPVASIISSLSARITSLSLNNLSPGVFFSFLDLPMTSWVHLQTLNIQLCNDTIQRTSVQHSSFQGALNLRDVTIRLKIRSHNSGTLLPLTSLFPWSQLTHLTIDQLALPWGTAHYILAQCIMITHCHLTVGRDPGATLTPSVIALSKLETFRVFQNCALVWSNFLKPFHFPSLKHIVIIPGARIHPDYEITFVHPMFSIDGVVELILRSQCRLETLSIGGDLRYNAKLPLIDLNVVPLLWESSSTLRTLVGSFILPASVFISMRTTLLDHLCHLEDVVLRLQTRGFRKFLDFLDSRITYDPEKRAHVYDGSIRQAAIWCHRDTGNTAAFKHYRRRAWLYREVGINIYVSFEDRPNGSGEHEGGDEDSEGEGEDDGEGQNSTDDEKPVRQQGGWLPHYIGRFLTGVV